MPAWQPDHFACRVIPDRHVVYVHPTGELDIATVGTLEDCLRELRLAGFASLVLDVTDLTFIDSTGVHLLLRWTAASTDDGFHFALAGHSEAVERLFELTGLREMIPVDDAQPG